MLVRTGLSAALTGDEKAMPEKVTPVKLKHLSAHPAMDAQSFALFCVLSLGTLWWWWWSQSGIVSDADISVAVALAAKPTAAGSVATDRATTTAKMVRPMRRVILYLVCIWSEDGTIINEIIGQNDPADIDQDQILTTAQDLSARGGRAGNTDISSAPSTVCLLLARTRHAGPDDLTWLFLTKRCEKWLGTEFVMPKKRFGAEQIATLLRQIEVFMAQGKSTRKSLRDVDQREPSR